jgi:hypothetical protein
VRLDACTSDFDTNLSGHTGSTLSSLTQVPWPVYGCTLRFDATAGTTYYIRIASWSSSPQGNFTLKVRTASAAPTNDNFGSAETISGPMFLVEGDNRFATEETGEPEPTDAETHSSVWYRWTSPFSGPLTIDTCYTREFDTVLSVHTGSALTNLAEVASNDQGCAVPPHNTNGSKVSFNATAGTLYYIRVASWIRSGEFEDSPLPQGRFFLVSVDNVAPATTITDGPYGLTSDDTPTFSFSGSDDKSASANLLYSYQVDNGGWSDYSAETSGTLDSLPEGAHTFYVKAKDESGNEEGGPAEQSFIVDARSPKVDTTSPAPGETNVPRLGNITATFSEPMKQSKITTTTIKMKVGKKAVPVALSLRDDGKTAMIDPYPADASRALAPSKKYKVTITTGAQDLSGRALDQNPALSGNQPKTWTFTTGST